MLIHPKHMTEPFNGPTRADVGTLGNRLAIKEPFKITFITDKKNKKKMELSWSVM